MNKYAKWLKIAEHIGAEFSTCVRRQYAAIILSEDGRIVSIGYNGSPPNYGHCNDGFCPRASMNVGHGTQYDNCIAVHAEANALMYSDISLRKNGVLIVNGPPCYSCAKLISTSGISKVIHKSDSEYGNYLESVAMMNASGIEVISL
jgi:dCMP deaminase